MKLSIPGVTALLLVFSLPVAAQSQLEINQDAVRDFEKADKELNTTYKQLVTRLDADGKKKLATAEKAWIAFRDAEAESDADDYRGGSIWPMIYNGVKQRLTVARTVDLKDRVKELDSR